MSISFFFLNGGFLQSGTPKSFLFYFPLWTIQLLGCPHLQPPNTDLPRNGFSQGDHSGLHVLDVEKHAWSEQTFTGTPPEKVGCTGGTLGCWIPQRRCQKISHPAWLIWDLGWHYSMLVCYSMASCHKEHLTHEAVWGSSFGLPHNTNYVSRMRSKGSRFTLGVWGLRVCSLDVAFVVATVCNRPRDPHMAVPMVSSADVVVFVGFKHLVASFRVAGVALRDIQTCFVTCRKSFRVAGAILLRRFPKMRCSFRGRRSTLDVSIVILRGRRSTLDVSCCVFFANRIGRAASNGDKVQIPWQAWHFVRCDENWRKPRTKHRFWGSTI